MRNSSLRFVPASAYSLFCLTAWIGAAFIVSVSSAAAASELYKCAGEGGIPLYQNMPCEKGKELRNLSNEDTLSVVPMRVEPSRLPPPSPAAPPAVTPPPAPPVVLPVPSAAMPNPTADLPPSQAPAQPPTPPQPSNSAPTATDIPSNNAPSVPPTTGIPEATPLGAAALARIAIRPGMTAAEVEARLGPPPMTGGPGADAPDQPMRWFYLPTEGDSDTITTIVLQRGKVTDVDRKPMKRDH